MTSIDPATIPDDPFEGIADDAAVDAAATVHDLLGRTKRAFVPLRNEFVQKHDGPDRAGILATLVRGRHHRALDALLLLHALQPILPDSPLPMSTWARMLSTSRPCTPNGASKAFAILEDLGLVTRELVPNSRKTVLTPLHETGSGAGWTRPGRDAPERFFTIPHEYWTSGLVDDLTLPGKAMFLIILKETQDPSRLTFSMPVSKAQEWYGISERTAERGYSQLGRHHADVLRVRVQKVADAKHPAGRREIHHRALRSPYSTKARAMVQATAAAAARGSASKPRQKGGERGEP